MLTYLILLFIAFPIIELALLIKIGQHIGLWHTVAIVIVTGVVGGYMAKMQGIITLGRIRDDINRGIMPADGMFDGLLILFSGVLLLTPGFITDIIGILGLIPFMRSILKKWLRQKIEQMIQRGEGITVQSYRINR